MVKPSRSYRPMARSFEASTYLGQFSSPEMGKPRHHEGGAQASYVCLGINGHGIDLSEMFVTWARRVHLGPVKTDHLAETLSNEEALGLEPWLKHSHAKVRFGEVALIGEVSKSSCVERHPRSVISAGPKCSEDDSVWEVYARKRREERPAHLKQDAYALKTKGTSQFVGSGLSTVRPES